MADENKRPDFDTFMKDPAFQGDRDLFSKYIDHHNTQKEVTAAKALLTEKKVDFAGKSDADILTLVRGLRETQPGTSKARSIFDW